MGFQRHINAQPAPGVEGDFASANPRSSVVPSVPGAWKVAPGQAVRVGYFAWGANDGLVYSSLAAAAAVGGAVIGFVARQPNEPAAMITAFLGESVMTLQPGREVTLLATGDYKVNLPGAAPNAAVYAVEATGAPSLIDDATTIATGFTAASAAKVNAVTAAGGASIAANTGIMTLGAPASGVYEAGQRVTGAGVPAETYIEAQLTGPVGGAGTYQTTSRYRAAVPAFLATMVQGTLCTISKY